MLQAENISEGEDQLDRDDTDRYDGYPLDRSNRNTHSVRPYREELGDLSSHVVFPRDENQFTSFRQTSEQSFDYRHGGDHRDGSFDERMETEDRYNTSAIYVRPRDSKQDESNRSPFSRTRNSRR